MSPGQLFFINQYTPTTMTNLKELLGKEFVDANGNKFDTSRLDGKVTMIYFSAHWCPPCRGFTPKLAELYKELVEKHPLEIVFVSSDKTEEAFKEYLGEMPWIALPFSDRDRKATLSKEFKVRGIPSLVILDAEGNLLTTNGREAVMSNPEGFPWKPPTLAECLGDTFVMNDGTEVSSKSFEGKHLGLYFSASWCPPCKAFTPKLINAYNKLKESGKEFEVVFVSGDRDMESFKGYHGKMPWLAIPFGDDKRKQALNSHFEVEGIPHFVILDADRNVVNERGVGAVSQDQEGAKFPWLPEPFMDIEEGAEFLNEDTCLVALLEGCDDPTQDSAKDVLAEIANEYAKKAKAGGEVIRFMYAKEENGITQQIRKLTSLNTPEEEPQLLLMDIPDNGGYYVLPPAEPTKESVEKFLSDFKGKLLERKQLG